MKDTLGDAEATKAVNAGQQRGAKRRQRFNGIMHPMDGHER
jgi:hypothetical protein